MAVRRPIVAGSPTAGGLAGMATAGSSAKTPKPIAPSTAARPKSVRAGNRWRTAAKTTANSRPITTPAVTRASFRVGSPLVDMPRSVAGDAERVPSVVEELVRGRPGLGEDGAAVG